MGMYAAFAAPLRRLREPLKLAGYITWLAVFASLFDGTPFEIDGSRTVVVAATMGFLAAFIARGWLNEAKERRHSLLIFFQAVFALVASAFSEPNFALPVLTIIVIVQLAMIAPLPVVIGAAILQDLALWLIFRFVWATERAWMSVLVDAGFQGFALVTAWYARRAEETATALKQANAHLLATQSLLEESARDQERLRLARELHDVAGHKLTALKINLKLLQRECDVATRPRVDTAARLSAELLDDVRGVVAQLRRDDGMDLTQALTRLAAYLPHPRVHLELNSEVRLDNVEKAEALLRAAQEALTNIVRHAAAESVLIRLHREGDKLHMQVQDDGHGTLPVREGHGLRGMRERLSACGGALRLSQAGAGGLVLDVTLPIG